MAWETVPVETLIQWKADAEIALHKLMTGSKETSVSYDGKAVTYTVADREDLIAYIDRLAVKIGELQGTVSRRAPLRMGF